jgi:hypothetical protein
MSLKRLIGRAEHIRYRKAYKKWLDATISDGEPLIQLTSTGDTKGEKGPPLPASDDTIRFP